MEEVCVMNFLDMGMVSIYLKNVYGVYYCKVANPKLPDLVLSSHTISVVGTGIDDGDREINIIQSNETLSIQTNGNYVGSTINIYNSVGELLHAQQLFTSDSNIDISTFTDGVYFYQISNENQIINNGKFTILK